MAFHFNLSLINYVEKYYYFLAGTFFSNNSIQIGFAAEIRSSFLWRNHKYKNYVEGEEPEYLIQS